MCLFTANNKWLKPKNIRKMNGMSAFDRKYFTLFENCSTVQGFSLNGPSDLFISLQWSGIEWNTNIGRKTSVSRNVCLLRDMWKSIGSSIYWNSCIWTVQIFKMDSNEITEWPVTSISVWNVNNSIILLLFGLAMKRYSVRWAFFLDTRYNQFLENENISEISSSKYSNWNWFRSICGWIR